MTQQKTQQKTVLDNLGLLLSSLSTVNNYRTDWDRVVYWQDVPTEYESNWLTYRDTFTEFTEGNRQHEQVLTVEIQAWLFGDDPATAGINALNDLIEILGTDQTLGGSCRFLQIRQCEKNFYNGRISELVYIPNQALLSNVEKLEGYLAWKWGLESNLPANHPYKTTPPIV